MGPAGLHRDVNVRAARDERLDELQRVGPRASFPVVVRIEGGAHGGGGGVDGVGRGVRYVLLQGCEILANLRGGVSRGLDHPRHPRDLLRGRVLGSRVLGSLFAVHRVKFPFAHPPDLGGRRRRRPVGQSRDGRSHRQRGWNPGTRDTVHRRPPRLLSIRDSASLESRDAHRQNRRAGSAVPGPGTHAVRIRADLQQLTRQGQRRRARALDHRAARVPQRGSTRVHGRRVSL